MQSEEKRVFNIYFWTLGLPVEVFWIFFSAGRRIIGLLERSCKQTHCCWYFYKNSGSISKDFQMLFTISQSRIIDFAVVKLDLKTLNIRPLDFRTLKNPTRLETRQCTGLGNQQSSFTDLPGGYFQGHYVRSNRKHQLQNRLRMARTIIMSRKCISHGRKILKVFMW